MLLSHTLLDVLVVALPSHGSGESRDQSAHTCSERLKVSLRM